MSSDTDPGRWNGAGNCIDPPLNLIITVIAESLDGDGRNIRFVEICSPDKKDFTATEDLLLIFCGFFVKTNMLVFCILYN